MPSKTRTWVYKIDMKFADTFKSSVMVTDFGALMDMLRYEGARVRSWDRNAVGYAITIESEHYSQGRWNSFGMYPYDIQQEVH